MHNVIRSGELEPDDEGTVVFEGKGYGSGASFFLIDNEPGVGPGLHRHPYPETWIVRSGTARITAGEAELEVGPGDIGVVAAGTAHKFRNMGPGRLEMICVHPSPEIIEEALE